MNPKILKKTIFILLLFLLFTSCTVNKTLRLNYTPHGKIIRFDIDSLKIYTDTAAVFSVVERYKDPSYKKRTRKLIMDKMKGSKSDTVIFTGHFIPFDDNVEGQLKNWYVDHVIIKLTNRKKVLIIDKHNNVVTHIKKKKTKWHSNNSFEISRGVKRLYINKDTGEELFNEILKYRGVIVEPLF